MSEPQRERHPIESFFDDTKTRWYHYALRRFPMSCLISCITLFLVFLFFGIVTAIYGWFAG